MRNIRIAICVFLGSLIVCSYRYMAAGSCCSHEVIKGESVVREADHTINPLFLKRYSGYALSGSVSVAEFESILEAARFAPSASNVQPWRFIYGKKGTAGYDKLFDLMVDFNKSWAKNADYLVLIISDTTSLWGADRSRTHSFDAGAAWQNMALQAADLGLIAHGMAGFDYDKAHATFELPDNWAVEALVAIGRPGSDEVLPEELRTRNKQQKESARKSISEIAWDGEFKK